MIGNFESLFCTINPALTKEYVFFIMSPYCVQPALNKHRNV